MIRKLSLVALLAWGTAWAGDVGTYCPAANADDCLDDECKCGALRTNVGDPVNLADGDAVFGRKDLEIRGSLRPLKLLRRFTSKPATWNSYADVDVSGVPTPFGRAIADARALHWSHNFFTYVNDASSHYRKPGGRVLTFTQCTAPCWASSAIGDKGQRERLWRNSGSVGDLVQDGDGTRYEFGSKFVGGGKTLYFLSAIRTADGKTTASITYDAPLDASGNPLANCLLGDLGTSPYVPYIRTIQNEDGVQLLFRYVVTGTGTQAECVLSKVLAQHVNAPAPTELVSYTYSSLYGWAPLLIGASTADKSEAYTPWSYPSAYFAVSTAGTETLHQVPSVYPCSAVSSTYGASENLTVTWGNGASYCTASDQYGYYRTIVDSAAGRGDGQAGSSSLQTKYWVSAVYGAFHQGALRRQEIQSCSPSQSCSLGSAEYNFDTTLGAAVWSKDRRGFYDLTPHGAAPSRPSYTLPLEALGRQRASSYGLIPIYPNCYGDGYDCEWYFHDYGPADEQRLSRTERQSLLGGLRVAETRQYDAGGNRLAGIVREGFTRDVNGTTSHKYIGTFFKVTRQGGNSCESAVADPQFRTLEVHGPCFVGASDMDCVGTDYPLTQYTYWPTAETSYRAGRLKKIARFPGGCASSPVVTQFNAYDVLGSVTESVDANGLTSTYQYQGSLLTQAVVAGKTTRYGYDNGKLAWTQFPEGNYEVTCHRISTQAGCDTQNGTWTERLQWKAKSATSTAATWSEKVKFTYWPDGTLAAESYRDLCWSGCNADSGEERRVVKHAADGQRRPTWDGWGSSAQYQSTRSFDAESNLTGIGHAYNSPPAWCAAPGLGAGTSPICTLMGVTPRGDVQTVSERPSPTSTPITTQFCYDSNGNVTVVRPDAPSGPYLCSPSSPDPKAAHYVYDDFGNLLESRLPNTEDGSGGQGVTRQEFDAFGNVTKRQTEEQRSLGQRYEYTYDLMGRNTAAIMYWGVPWTLYSKDWDDQGPHISGCSTPNSMGRLRSVTDPLGTTWYGYDARGLVVSEIRQRPSGACGSASTEATPNSYYSYTDNGNLGTVTYPHARVVEYLYDTSSGRNDRVNSIRTKFYSATGWSPFTYLVGGVQWEPYGSVRNYYVQFPDASKATVDNLLGDDTSQAPASACSSAMPQVGSGDKTGRLRSLTVSTDWDLTGRGDIYKRTYTWRADQVAKIDTCYLGATSGQSEAFPASGTPLGFDQLLRLQRADGSGGGPFVRRNFTYDNRGNRLTMDIDNSGNRYTQSYSAVAQLPDQLVRVARNNLTGNGNWNEFLYDRDGRTTLKSWPGDSGGSPAYQLQFMHVSDNAIGPGADTVFKAVGVNFSQYNYWYDAQSRRRRKDYPVAGVSDEFFYDQGHQMLEDRGNGSVLARVSQLEVGGRGVHSNFCEGKGLCGCPKSAS